MTHARNPRRRRLRACVKLIHQSKYQKHVYMMAQDSPFFGTALPSSSDACASSASRRHLVAWRVAALVGVGVVVGSIAPVGPAFCDFWPSARLDLGAAVGAEHASSVLLGGPQKSIKRPYFVVKYGLACLRFERERRTGALDVVSEGCVCEERPLGGEERCWRRGRVPEDVANGVGSAVVVDWAVIEGVARQRRNERKMMAG